MNILSDKLWGRKYSRWVALTAYLIGLMLLQVAWFTHGKLGLVFAEAALVLWVIPVCWAAYKWSKT